MNQIQAIRQRQNQERAALQARQKTELALHVCSNSLSARQQAVKFGVSYGEVLKLRKIWRNYNPTEAQPWEPSI